MAILNMVYGGDVSSPSWAIDLVAYRPLKNDANDHKSDLGIRGNVHNGTWSGTAQYGTVGGRTGAYFSSNSYIDTGVNYGANTITFACSLYKNTAPDTWWTSFGSIKNSNPNYGIFGRNDRKQIFLHGGDSTDTIVVNNYSLQTRYNIVGTVNGDTIKYYLNGSLVGQKSGGGTISGYNWGIGSGILNYGNGSYISDCAIWYRVLSDSEISDFNTYINS